MTVEIFKIKNKYEFHGQEVDGFKLKPIKVKQRLLIAKLIDALPNERTAVANLEFEQGCLAVITGADVGIFTEMDDKEYHELLVKAAPFMPTGWASMLSPSNELLE